MRRVERIDEILAKIKEVWIQVPDQRLGQVLENYFGYPRTDIFFIEDDVFGVKVFDNDNGWKKFGKELGIASKKLEKAMKQKKNKKKNEDIDYINAGG